MCKPWSTYVGLWPTWQPIHHNTNLGAWPYTEQVFYSPLKHTCTMVSCTSQTNTHHNSQAFPAPSFWSQTVFLMQLHYSVLVGMYIVTGRTGVWCDPAPGFILLLKQRTEASLSPRPKTKHSVDWFQYTGSVIHTGWSLGRRLNKGGKNLASSPGPSQILSRSCGEKWGEGLGAKLSHGPEMVDSVSTNRVHITY